MRVPSSLLRETITIEAFLGAAAYGPKYGPATSVKARVEGRRRAVRTADGTDVIASATAIVRPEVEVTPESRVVHDGRTYEVLDVLVGEGLTRPAYRELILA